MVAPGRLPEIFAKMQQAFVRAGEQDSVTPIYMFYREWAVIVEIERRPEIARRLHAAEQALMSDDAQVRAAATRLAVLKDLAGRAETEARLSSRRLATRWTPVQLFSL